MADALSSGLLLPALALACVAWIVPILLSRVMAEGLKPLILLAFFATIILFLISSVFFLALYLFQGAPISTITQFSLVENIVFFGRLGLTSAIIWAPIMILSVMNRPRYWVKETW